MWFQNKKKKYFKKYLVGVEHMIWDLDFKKEKSLMIREEVRMQYEGVRAKLNITEEKIKLLPEDKTKWSDEDKRLEDEQVRLSEAKIRHEGQMKGIDIDVFGSPKTNEFPDGVDGIEQKLDSLRELKDMVKVYIKTL